jgi:sulfite reductase alpha subunit-like flavoprotein
LINTALTDITKEENLFVVISTQGDGEPPVAAQKFYDHIHRNGFRLDQTKFSVLALGDTSYPDVLQNRRRSRCAIGKIRRQAHRTYPEM